MNYEKLEKNIIDVIKEEQVKLGYRSELVHLYYPLSSLNNFLQTDCGIEQMQQNLKKFCDFAEEKLGRIEISNKEERFCFAIPPEGIDYIHEHMEPKEFVRDFIHTIEKHGCTIEDIVEQFRNHSDCVHVEKVSHGEFDYLIYFEDGKPDDFRYCITDEGCHMIYHRFTPEDYRDMDL